MPINENETFDAGRLKKIESDLLQIKALLAILIIIALTGFYGLAEVVGFLGKTIFWLGIALAVGYLILLVLEKLLGLKKSPKTDKEIEEAILKEFETLKKT